MRHTDCAVTWNRGPWGLPGPSTCPDPGHLRPATQSPQPSQVSLSPERWDRQSPRGPVARAPRPLHTLEITLSLSLGSLLPVSGHLGCTLSSKATFLSAQLGLGFRWAPRARLGRTAQREWTRPSARESRRAMEGLVEVSATRSVRSCLVSHWLAPGWPGARRTAVSLSCRAAGRDRDMARLMGPCSCPEVERTAGRVG